MLTLHPVIHCARRGRGTTPPMSLLTVLLYSVEFREDATGERSGGGACEVASEAAGTVSQCLSPQARVPQCGQLRCIRSASHYFTVAMRWRELALERAAALECGQAPQAIPSRKWPRCLIGATHASWPRHAALECIWAWFPAVFLALQPPRPAWLDLA